MTSSTDPGAPAPRTDPPCSWPSPRSIGLLVVVLGLAAFVAGFGRVTAIEFSPRTFEHRSVSYYRAPFLGLQVTPTVVSQPWRSPLADWLAACGLVEAVSREQDWLFVKGSARELRGWHGPAKRLCLQLGCYSGDDERWVAWSSAHPEIAAELWPCVIAAARAGDVDRASCALHAAEAASTVEEYRSSLALLTAR